MLRTTASARITALFVALAALFAVSLVSAPAADAAVISNKCSTWTTSPFYPTVHQRTCLVLDRLSTGQVKATSRVELKNVSTVSQSVRIKLSLSPKYGYTASKTVSTTLLRGATYTTTLYSTGAVHSTATATSEVTTITQYVSHVSRSSVSTLY